MFNTNISAEREREKKEVLAMLLKTFNRANKLFNLQMTIKIEGKTYYYGELDAVTDKSLLGKIYLEE